MPVSSQWFANPGSTYEIDQSIRFNDDDSAQLSKTYSGAGNRKTASISMWIKRANISATMDVFGVNSSNLDTIRFNSNNTMMIRVGNADSTTNRVFRDVGAWGHLFIVRDTTQSTSTNRLKAWWNNEALTFSTYSVPSQDADTEFMNAVIHRIGTEGGGGSQFFDGYLAEIHVIDGTAKAATDFGEVSTTTGQWIPKEYTGSYGDNGFYIDGRDSSDLGDDESGEGNDYASSGLSTADQVTDSPTSNFCTWNAIDAGSGTLSDGNLVLASTTDRSGTFAMRSGKWAWKITTAASGAFGIVADSLTGTETTYSAGSGEVLEFQLDLSAGTLEVSVDGGSYSSVASSLSGIFFPLAKAACTADFGQSGFTRDDTTFNYLSTSSLSPSVTDPSLYFQTTLYTGNGSTQSITNGGNSDLQPDLVWIKNRDATDSNVLTDAVRGVTKILSTDSTGAESTDADTVTAFASDGFALGDDDKVNTSSENYVSWQWKADSAWSESATGNILASSGRRNTTVGFSICSWTHRTSANYAIRHGLSTTPEFFMTKSRDSTTNWDTWHKDLADTAKRILINGTGAEITAYWVDVSDSADGSGSYGDISSGESPVTSSLFGFQHDNFSGTDAIIGYFFHSVEGYSSFGSYVGNGSATAGPFVYTGFRPSLVVTKNITNSGDAWPVADSARAPFNVANATVFWNQNTAETTGYSVDLLSNGFRPYSSDHGINESGATYIYAAWAESPFKTSLAR